MFKMVLKKLRQEANLTQRELSEILDLTPAAIGLYEQGRRKPDFDILEKLADYFNVSIDFLLRGTTPPKHSRKEVLEVTRIYFSKGELLLNRGNKLLTAKQKKALVRAIESMLDMM